MPSVEQAAGACGALIQCGMAGWPCTVLFPRTNRTVAIGGRAFVMAKSNLRLVPPPTENRTVAGAQPPRRPPNRELREREHLTDAEVERLNSKSLNAPNGSIGR